MKYFRLLHHVSPRPSDIAYNNTIYYVYSSKTLFETTTSRKKPTISGHRHPCRSIYYNINVLRSARPHVTISYRVQPARLKSLPFRPRAYLHPDVGARTLFCIINSESTEDIIHIINYHSFIRCVECCSRRRRRGKCNNCVFDRKWRFCAVGKPTRLHHILFYLATYA